MLSFVTLATCLIPLIPAAPAINQKRVAAPTVTLNTATVVGSSSGGIDSFKGIPYAQPPVGQLRLKPPQSVTSNLGTIQATGTPKACPQFYSSVNTANIPSAVLGDLLDTPLVQAITDSGEDCLTVNVQRPSSANSASKLPVVYWMFGGGFEFGSTQSYDASEFITSSVSQGKEFIYVSVNYRVGGFGFLPGAEILKDGSANLALLDQRLGLEWTADNIEAFGGDPEKVTIWGESAGAISVFDQMALYNGNNTYKGKPLFRSGIMDSGSIIPADPVDCPKGQTIYNAVVSSAGCSGSADTLSCLRSLDYETYLNAANSVPAIFSFNSLALSYLPRPDGVTLTASPDVLAQKGLYANIPFIIGDQEDEGTLFALTQTNLSTTADLVSYFQSIYFFDATEAQIQGLVDVYPDEPAQGSPFGTGELYNIYPQYKRLAAILGDITFTLTRRLFLSITSTVNPNTPTYSYLATYDDAIPLLGTFHASDILPAYGLDPGVATSSIQAYYSNFIVNLDPNNGTTGLGLVNWPQWAQGEQLLNFGAVSNSLLADNFREAQYEFLAANSFNFHI